MFHTLHCPRCRAWLYCPGRVGASAVQPPDPWRPFVPGPLGALARGGREWAVPPRTPKVGTLGNCATLTPPGRRVAGSPLLGSQARGLCPGAGPWVNARGGTWTLTQPAAAGGGAPGSAAPTCARRQLNPSAAAPSRCRRQAVPGERKLSG
ncbi:hypothetical protein GQ602_007391 [Ophiocordyceps camponoti-floridani]|uniref:Uncharacterized protein n=1 Tax=Ophiocordyceps camponoti-floridani TaxID=2030778 RepID=A0A8H4VAZ0_9HYPO|nr:hypothetical protein GQ602_007391 [Ophiocordyceps camponoti-floridani]